MTDDGYVEISSYAEWTCPKCGHTNYQSAGSITQYEFLSCENCDEEFQAANDG